MGSTNQSPSYKRAEAEYLEAKTIEERIECLKIMIRECPKHKSSEKMLKNLKTRLKKLEQTIKKKPSQKSTQKSIKKSLSQCVLVGFPNSGKSTVFNALTNRKTPPSSHPFSTTEPVLGTFDFEDIKIQLIDSPSFPIHNKSIINSAPCIILVIDDINQIKEAERYLYRITGKKIILFNSKNHSKEELEKIKHILDTKFKDSAHMVFSLNHAENLDSLKRVIFSNLSIIRIYTKEPKKEPSPIPMILKENSTVYNVAEKIAKGFSKKIKRIKIWGPSSKFPGQIVGITHQLKDKDIIEFLT